MKKVLVICACGWAVSVPWGEALSYVRAHENHCQEDVEVGGPIGGV